MDTTEPNRPSPAGPSRAAIVRAAILWGSILVAIVAFRNVALPFGIALLIAYVCDPIVTWIARVRVAGRNVPRWAGIIAVYAAFGVGVWGFSVLALPQLYREVVRLSAEARQFFNELTPEKIEAYTRSAEAWLDTHGIPVVFGEDEPLPDPGPKQPGGLLGESRKLHFDLEAAIRQTVSNGTAWARTHLVDMVEFSQRLISRVLGGVFMAFFVLMVAAFLLIDTASIRAFFRSLVPVEWRGGFDELLAGIDQKLAGVVRGQILICLINGALTLLGLLLFKVKFALILAIGATVLSFIPIFGTVISTIPIVLVALSQSFGTATAALSWVLGIHAVEAYMLNPKVMGTSARIHPVLVAFALLAGERTFGFVGALLAVPVASVLLAVFAHFKARTDRLQGEAPAALAPHPPDPAEKPTSLASG
ncbi:MAG TPA: AI-2E family transporter [Vulgatibacter sp.]|nr:AI-2E family transporter [Vulgatibacter sp.]